MISDSARNFYINVQTATTVSRFNELLQTYGKTSYIPPSIQAVEYLPTSVYKVRTSKPSEACKL